MVKFSRRRLMGAALAGSLWLGCPAFALGSRIDEAGFVRIGGIDQWIDIRGASPKNPVLLVVHGGPGEAQWPAAARYAPWEGDFTVVQWDQRGAGHTFGRYGDQTPDVSLERIVSDGIEVAQYLERRLSKRKIIVLGHSWGSLVAATMVGRWPDLFAAYVGTGQVSSWRAVVETQFDVLLAKARADNDAASIKLLQAIGRPDPSNIGQYFQFTRGLQAAMPAPDQAWLKGMRAMTAAPTGATSKDARDLESGMMFSTLRVLPDMIKADLPATAPEIRTAFFVIQGRDDITTPTSAAVAYFNAVQAPQKGLTIIDHAGHFAFMTHPEAFLAALKTKVRPVAVARGA
jgi:pimeloyl-ACP methyl ester carboxylesterase